MVRPGLPKMSPMKRMRTLRGSRVSYAFRWYHDGRRRLASAVRTARTGLRHQLRCLKEIVIAGGAEVHVAQTTRVYQHVVEIPEIDVRELLRHDLLNTAVVGFEPLPVYRGASIVDEPVDLRVGVIAAICPSGRSAGGGKNVFENVRILVAADPAQGEKLECAASDVGVVRSEFKAADIERDAHFTQL